MIKELKKDSMLKYKDVVLRYFREGDIEKFIEWNVYDSEWKLWDAPWQNRDRSEEKTREFLAEVLKRPAERIPGRLQICHADGTYIGLVGSYLIDDDEMKRAIGIDICEKEYWCKGLGTQSIILWIAYLFKITGNASMYCETWSGNVRMVKSAQKCGFKEIKRVKNKRFVRGQYYDALAFVLHKEEFIKENLDIWKDIDNQLA